MKKEPLGISRWISDSVFVGVALFIMALTLSALWVPQLRLLHFFQALIYVAILLLTRRNNPWGYGVGVIIPVAWNCLNLFVTHLFEAGALQLWSFLHTGHLDEPVSVMVTLGCVAHFLLITACMAGMIQLLPSAKQWAQFFAGGALALVYFAGMIVTVAPH